MTVSFPGAGQTKRKGADPMDERITAIVVREKAEYDQLTVRCGLCDWSSTGTNTDTQAAAKTHRDTEHPREWEVFRRNHVRRNSAASVQWPKDRCLAFLVAWVTEHKRRPRMEDFAGKTTETQPSSAIIRRAFGESWKAAADAAIALADLPEPEPKPKPPATPMLRRAKETDMDRVAMSRDQMIEAMQTFYREEGVPPERRHFETDRKHGLPSMSPLKREFGGVIAARDAAGVPQPDPFREAPPSHAPSKDEVLEAMVRWHGEHGAMPRSSDWQQPGSVRGAYPNYDQSVKHGPWRELVAEAMKSTNGSDVAEATTADTNRFQLLPDLDAPAGELKWVDATHTFRTVAPEEAPTAEPTHREEPDEFLPVVTVLQEAEQPEEPVADPAAENLGLEEHDQVAPAEIHASYEGWDLGELAAELQYTQEQYEGWQERHWDARRRFFSHPVMVTLGNEWGLDDEQDFHSDLATAVATEQAKGDRALAMLVKLGWNEESAKERLAKIDQALPFFVRAREALRRGD